MIIAALHANSAFDEHAPEKREEAIRSTEDSFSGVMEYLKARQAGETIPDEYYEDSVDADDPFWKPVLDTEEKLGNMDGDGADVATGEVVGAEESAADMKRMLAEMDQT